MSIRVEHHHEPKRVYASAVSVGDLVFLSGATAYGEGARAQTRAILSKLQEACTAAGVSLNDAVKATVYLVRVEDWDEMNAAFAEYFVDSTPARSTVVVAALADREFLVEIDVVCARQTPMSSTGSHSGDDGAKS